MSLAPYTHRTARHRVLQLERLEARRLLAGDWQNAESPWDVDRSGVVTPLDALLVINDLNAGGSRELAGTPGGTDPRCDVTGDGWLTPVDALHIINALSQRMPLAVTAHLAPESDPDGNAVVLVPRVTLLGQTQPGARVQWRIDAAPAAEAAVDEAGRFQFQVDLAAGLNTIRVEARDRLGQVATVAPTVRWGDVVLDWNASLLNVIRDWTTLSDDPYANRVVTAAPPLAARNLAMVHGAMYDALNAFDRAFEAFLVDVEAPHEASPIAAAAAAAHRVASNLYVDADELAVWDAALAEALTVVPDGPAESLGIAFGRQVGDAVLAARADDGADAPEDWSVPGSGPGEWNRTFPDYLPPLLTQWPGVRPFAMTSGDQFRPPVPPALDSAEYAADVAEVQRIGGFESVERTAEQTEIALFWADGGGTFTPPGHWNQIAADVSLARGAGLADNARLFALLNIALADAGIAAWDAKYAYNLWRPIDAIRRADTDSNLATAPDANWIPLLRTPPFPTYTSGHSTFGGAADAVLTVWFGEHVAFSTTLDGHEGFTQRPLADTQIVTRHFASFAQAADEAGRSRIYGGIHFEFDNAAGLAAGRALGAYVAANVLGAG
jgi:hypothetical protein